MTGMTWELHWEQYKDDIGMTQKTSGMISGTHRMTTALHKAYLFFPYFLFASLHSAYYFFNMLFFHGLNSKIF